MHAFLRRLWHSQVPLRLAMPLLALALLCFTYHVYSAIVRHQQIRHIDDAAQHGDSEKVKALLKDNPDLVFSRDKEGNTPLLWAVRFGFRDVAELLLAHGTDVNVADNKGRTSFCWAAMMDDSAMKEFLSQHGAHPPDATIFDAATYGDLEKVKTLLKADPDLVSNRDINGYTPVHLAAKNGHKDIVELLLAYKADVNVKATDPTAQINALSREHPDENFALPNMRETPLHLAVANNHKDVVKLLLANKADVNAREFGGFTPLLSAVLAGHTDIAELLLASGADVKAGDDSGQTALHWAAGYGLKDMAALLLVNKADVNAKDKMGKTPLQSAEQGMIFPYTQWGCREVFALLLANHADVDARDKKGETPLEIAADSCYPDIVRLLISNKAEVDARDDKGWTPLHFALGQEGIAKVLLADKADVNTRDTTGRTPLHFAAELPTKDVAELLLTDGAEVNAKDNDGDTPLDVAMGMEHYFPESERQPIKDMEDLLRQHGGHK